MAVRRRKDIVLVGARGQAKDLIGLLEDDGRFRIVCLIDEIEATQVLGHEVVRPEAYDGGCRDALLAIGLPDGKVAVLAQYERFGGFRLFLERYLHECITIGYPAAPLEQEAKRVENEVCH